MDVSTHLLIWRKGLAPNDGAAVNGKERLLFGGKNTSEMFLSRLHIGKVTAS